MMGLPTPVRLLMLSHECWLWAVKKLILPTPLARAHPHVSAASCMPSPNLLIHKHFQVIFMILMARHWQIFTPRYWLASPLFIARVPGWVGAPMQKALRGM